MRKLTLSVLAAVTMISSASFASAINEDKTMLGQYQNIVETSIMISNFRKDTVAQRSDSAVVAADRRELSARIKNFSSQLLVIQAEKALEDKDDAIMNSLEKKESSASDAGKILYGSEITAEEAADTLAERNSSADGVLVINLLTAAIAVDAQKVKLSDDLAERK